MANDRPVMLGSWGLWRSEGYSAPSCWKLPVSCILHWIAITCHPLTHNQKRHRQYTTLTPKENKSKTVKRILNVTCSRPLAINQTQITCWARKPHPFPMGISPHWSCLAAFIPVSAMNTWKSTNYPIPQLTFHTQTPSPLVAPAVPAQ